MHKKKLLLILLSFILLVLIDMACKHEPIPPVIPDNSYIVPPGSDSICFSDEILPLIQSYCAYTGCHAAGSDEPMSLATYNDIMQYIQASNAEGSELYQAIIGGGEEPMPPSGNPLSTSQVVLIHNWIMQGANNSICSCDSTLFTFSGAVWPTIQGQCTGCHSGSNPAGNPALDLSTYGNIVNAVNSQNLYGRITGTSGAVMPPGNKMSDCRIKQVNDWINAGMLNN